MYIYISTVIKKLKMAKFCSSSALYLQQEYDSDDLQAMMDANMDSEVKKAVKMALLRT